MEKKCRKVIKQENCETTIKIPKNSTASTGTTIQLTTKSGQQIIGQKIGQNFIFHKNQIILDSPKISFKGTNSVIARSSPPEASKTFVPTGNTDHSIKQEPQETNNRYLY